MAPNDSIGPCLCVNHQLPRSPVPAARIGAKIFLLPPPGFGLYALSFRIRSASARSGPVWSGPKRSLEHHTTIEEENNAGRRAEAGQAGRGRAGPGSSRKGRTPDRQTGGSMHRQGLREPGRGREAPRACPIGPAIGTPQTQ
ncbi:unnamed protein product [Calypogeia fissa]